MQDQVDEGEADLEEVLEVGHDILACHALLRLVASCHELSR